jgi:hypothetical protein
MSARRRPEFRPGLDRLDDRVLLSAVPLTPAQIRQAYSENVNFLVNGRTIPADGAGQTIAIVDAGYHVFMPSDLNTTRSTDSRLPDSPTRSCPAPGPTSSGRDRAWN